MEGMASPGACCLWLAVGLKRICREYLEGLPGGGEEAGVGSVHMSMCGANRRAIKRRREGREEGWEGRGIEGRREGMEEGWEGGGMGWRRDGVEEGWEGGEIKGRRDRRKDRWQQAGTQCLSWQCREASNKAEGESREVTAFPSLSPHSGLSSVGVSVLHSSLQKNPSSARVLCMTTFEKGISLRTLQCSLCYCNKRHRQGGLDTTDADLHCPQGYTEVEAKI